MKTIVPEGYKKTKAGIIPEDWIEKKAGDLFINVSNKKHNGEFEILAATQDKGVIPRSMLDLDIKTSEESINSYKLIEIGSFIISLRSFQGGIEYSYYKGLVSPAYTVLKENEPINKDFYKYLFKKEDFIKKLNSLIFGIRDGKQISYSDFSTMYLQYPPLIQQNKIAQILTTWDEAIIKQEELITEKEQLKKGLMQKLLSGEVRFDEFNDGWQEIKLGKVFAERTSRAGEEEHELLAVTMANGVVKRDEVDIKDNSSNDKSNYKQVKINDIAYNTMRMWQGASGVSKYNGIVSPAYTIVYLKKDYDIDFFGYLFKTHRVIFDFYRYSQGLTSDTWNIKYPHFSEVKVKIPTNKEEQSKIVEVLKKSEEEINLLKNEFEELKLQKKALMQKLLTGQVRVKV